VVLVDGDLRRPSIGAWLDPAPSLGLSEILSNQAELDGCLLDLHDSHLKILPAGRQAVDPVELLNSDRATSVMAELRVRFRHVIVDTAPILGFTDANVLAGLADGVFMVARSGVTPKAAYLQALSMITSSRILGTVLNDATYALADRDQYYGDYYSEYYDERK